MFVATHFRGEFTCNVLKDLTLAIRDWATHRPGDQFQSCPRKLVPSIICYHGHLAICEEVPGW
jgi:hypothetical protein